MRHFVAYHNSEKMGYSAEESDPFSVYTSKCLGEVIGDTVWVIAGEEDGGRKYRLSSWFVIDSIEPSNKAAFGSTLRGIRGGAIDPKPILNDLAWFPDFFKKMAHFSLGVQEIKQSGVVDALKKLASDAEHPAP